MPEYQIDRASAADLMQRSSGHGSAPMQVAGVLVLQGRPAFDDVRTAIGERIRSVPRLRRRLTATPFGAGRPIWVDDPGFEIDAHVRAVCCPPPGGETELLAVAAGLLTDPLPPDRPPWSVTHVDGLDGGRTALVVLVDHVLADGVGGLAVLERLVDGSPAMAAGDFPSAPPPRRVLVRDALRSRARVLGRLPSFARLLAGAWRELAPAVRTRAPRCSLNRPTGPARRLALARAELGAVRSVAHDHGGTVNDVVLTAVTGALHTLLAGRGEQVDRFVVSIPVTPRRHTDAGRLGNLVGVLPIELPATGESRTRLERTARIVRSRKTAAPGASVAVLAPVLRLLDAVGLFGRYVSHQHQVSTLVTNIRGPDHRLSFLGLPVAEIIPVTTTTGNVTVCFAVLSYAGRLTVTVVADPATCPDLPALVSGLQHELDRLTEISCA
jgi:diacylglycerol O-acyltransferase / wax synthase